MRILLVAPSREDLNVAEEAAAVSNAHRATLLQGRDVREKDVRIAVEEAVKRREWYDVIWFATHSCKLEDGRIVILLSGSEVLGVEALTSYAASARARLIVLDTCESIMVANKVHNRTKAAVIATITDADDTAAVRTGALLAAELGRQDNLQLAFDAVKADDNYVFLPGCDGRPAVEDAQTIPGPDEHWQKIENMLDELRDQFREAVSELGRLARDVAVLQAQMTDVRTQMEDVRDRLAIEPRRAPNFTWMTLLLGSSGLILVLVIMIAIYLLSGGR